MPKLLVIHGAGMQMRGKSQIEVFGKMTLPEYDEYIHTYAKDLGFDVEIFMSNSEGEVIDKLYAAFDAGDVSAAIINPAGYTTTSIALMDALLATELPVIEVHVTNIHKREEFRHNSYVSKVATGVICGLGIRGYALALHALADILEES